MEVLLFFRGSGGVYPAEALGVGFSADFSFSIDSSVDAVGETPC